MVDCKWVDLADPSEARGCSTNSLVINRFIQSVRDSTSSYKIDYVVMIKNFLNPNGHQNPFSGSKVTAILLKGWTWPIGEVAPGRVCACSLHSRLVCKVMKKQRKAWLPTGLARLVDVRICLNINQQGVVNKP